MITEQKRTSVDVRKEYGTLAQELGDAYVMKTELEAAIQERYDKMQGLKKEFFELEKQEVGTVSYGEDGEFGHLKVNGI